MSADWYCYVPDCILSRMGTLSGEGTVIFIVATRVIGVISWKKEFAPTGANFFL